MVARSLWDAAAAAVVAVVTTLATAADGSLLTVERGTDERLSQLRERERADGHEPALAHREMDRGYAKARSREGARLRK